MMKILSLSTFLSLTLILGLLVVLGCKASADAQSQGSLLSRSSTGAVFDEPRTAYLKHLGMKKPPKGALVVKVFSGTPAEKAGIQSGDVIQVVNGERIKRCRELLSQLNQGGAGANLQLLVRRGKKKLDITVTKVADTSITDPAFEVYRRIQQSLAGMSIYDPNAAKKKALPDMGDELGRLIEKAKENEETLFLVRLQALSRRLKRFK